LISVSDATKATGLTFPPSNALVAQLTELGLLKELTGQKRNRFFRYEPYIRLLQRD
jgi:hypothetical protein